MAASPLDRHSPSDLSRRGAPSLRGAPAPRPEIGSARRGRRAAKAQPAARGGGGSADPAAASVQAGGAALAFGEAQAAALTRRRGDLAATPASLPPLAVGSDRPELLCSVIGLAVKLGLLTVAGISLLRLAGVYQERMERQGEIAAVLELQTAKLVKARQRFEQLFSVEGEQRLIREQSQWIAPNRLRVIWQQSAASSSVQTAGRVAGAVPGRP